MQFTLYGLIILLAGAIVWRRGVSALFTVTVIASAFGGSAAVLLPAAGDTSISPAHFSLLLPILWICLNQNKKEIPLALNLNAFFILYAAYGVMSAIIFPRLYAGTILVIPMKPKLFTGLGDPLYVNLAPLSQNFSQAVYLVGTVLTAAMATFVAASDKKSNLIIKALVAATAIHVTFGVIDLVASLMGNTHLLAFLRNGNYAQLTQEVGGFKRISGSFPEPSAYASYGLACLFLVTELWLRNVWPRVTGGLAAAMAVMLLITTSSTAYGGIFLYGVLLGIRLLFMMRGRGLSTRMLALVVAGVVGTALAMVLAVLVPRFFTAAQNIFLGMTVHKGDSDSARVRMNIAMQGWTAFRHSHGFGIGVGTFRSSSSFMAILGTTGVVGIATFGAYLIRLAAPFRSASYRLDLPQDRAIAEAAATAALMALVPAAFSAPSGDPGIIFALMAGFALGRRASLPAESGLPAPAAPTLSALRAQERADRRRRAIAEHRPLWDDAENPAP